MEVLSRFAAIERASIDEAYLDLTGSARERLRELRGSAARGRGCGAERSRLPALPRAALPGGELIHSFHSQPRVRSAVTGTGGVR